MRRTLSVGVAYAPARQPVNSIPTLDSHISSRPCRSCLDRFSAYFKVRRLSS